MATNDVKTIAPAKRSDGITDTARGSVWGGQLVAKEIPDFFELVSRGRLFVATIGTAGVAPETTLDTTPPFTLYNPDGSGKLLVPVYSVVGYVSGTLGAGSLSYAYVPNQTSEPSGGTALTVQNCLLGNAAGSGKPRTGSTHSATPTLLEPAFMFGAFAGGAESPKKCFDYLFGRYAIQERTAFVIQGAPLGAGTSPLVMLGLCWAEIEKPS